MCGILGAVNLPFSQEILDIITHRGPDDSGMHETVVAGKTVTLGQRRLSIVDLSPAGHQPMLTPDGRHMIVFNGEVYNHEDFKPKVTQYAFRGHSDTETVLYRLAQDGIETAREFNGIFAFGFVDIEKAKLYLVRDPFGIKPLYYWCKNGKLVFSSEIKPIQKLVNESLDLDSLAETLRMRFTPSPDTLLTGIRKVLPGHVVEVNLASNDLNHREYPYIEPIPEERSISFNEALEGYGELFEKAVRRQLMSDVELGVLLSGGVDSALVAAFGQKHSETKLKAFTVGYTDRSRVDEIAPARETADVIGMEHLTTRIGFDDFLSTIRKCTTIVEEPLATASLIPMYYLSELVSKHVKVVLSGQGADESLGGYTRYKGEIVGPLLPSRLARLATAGAKRAGLRNEQILRGLQAASDPDEVGRFLKTYEVFEDAEIVKLVGQRDHRARRRVEALYDLLGVAKRRKSVERMMSLDLRLNLSDDLLLYTDKITMNFSIECRVPMLDLDLVRFIESLPARHRVNLRGGKIVHKAFAEKALPARIVNRKKLGFQTPTEVWFGNMGVLKEILLDPGSAFANHFDLHQVERTLDEYARGYARQRHIFLLLGMHTWMNEFL